MRPKWAVLVLVTAALLAVAGLAQAQGGGTLAPDQWTEGTLTLEDCVHTYTFQGTAGSLVTVEGFEPSGAYQLDPALVLADSTGSVLDSNDDFAGLSSLLVASLPADGEYQVLMMPSGLYTSQTSTTDPISTWTLACAPDLAVGTYRLRLSTPSLLGPGQTVQAALDSDEELEAPSFFVMQPDTDVTWAFTFEQPGGELYAQLQIVSLDSDFFFGSETVVDLSGTMGVRSATLNVDLTGGTTYLLQVQQSLFSFPFEALTADVTVTVSEAG